MFACMKQPNRKQFFWTCMCIYFHRNFAWQVGLFFVLTARLRDDAEMFERGIQEFASFSFCMKGSNNVFI